MEVHAPCQSVPPMPSESSASNMSHVLYMILASCLIQVSHAKQSQQMCLLVESVRVYPTWSGRLGNKSVVLWFLWANIEKRIPYQVVPSIMFL